MKRSDCAERAPHQRVRHAEKVQSEAGDDAVDAVDERLHQQLPADARAGFVEGLGGHGQAAVADQPDQPVAQIAAFEQHEDHQRHHQARGAERSHDRTEPREPRKARTGCGGDHARAAARVPAAHRTCRGRS